MLMEKPAKAGFFFLCVRYILVSMEIIGRARNEGEMPLKDEVIKQSDKPSNIFLMRSAILSSLLLAACGKPDSKAVTPPVPSTSASLAIPSSIVSATASTTVLPLKSCPADMVKVNDTYCVDRYEASMIEPEQNRRLSPNYPPHPYHARDRYSYWTDPEYDLDGGILRLEEEEDRTTLIKMTFPKLPEWQIETERYRLKATSEQGVTPNAYVSYQMAKATCKTAGKRLCTEDEWMTACRGEKGTENPYGNEYLEGACNVRRLTHPALQLYGRTGYFMSDPRYNIVTEADGKPLLEKTGSRPECRSPWGEDGIYDMVGNLAEWVEDGRKWKRGTFRGGFYSLHSPNGCSKAETGHSKVYYDYSIGTRCCTDAK